MKAIRGLFVRGRLLRRHVRLLVQSRHSLDLETVCSHRFTDDRPVRPGLEIVARKRLKLSKSGCAGCA